MVINIYKNLNNLKNLFTKNLFFKNIILGIMLFATGAQFFAASNLIAAKDLPEIPEINNNNDGAIGIFKKIITSTSIDKAIEALFGDKKAEFMQKAKTFSKYSKYAAIIICAYCAYSGLKETIDTAKTLLPIGPNAGPIDLILYPFKLLLLPFKAFGAFKSFFLSGGFAIVAYALHKAGNKL